MKIYGYGIVDKDRKPWWGEWCAYQDRGVMEHAVQELNAESWNTRRPYRVVRLMFSTATKPKRKERV